MRTVLCPTPRTDRVGGRRFDPAWLDAVRQAGQGRENVRADQLIHDMERSLQRGFLRCGKTLTSLA